MKAIMYHSVTFDNSVYNCVREICIAPVVYKKTVRVRNGLSNAAFFPSLEGRKSSSKEVSIQCMK